MKHPLTQAARELRRQGWRVRRKESPRTLACEARWDFVYIVPKSSSDGAQNTEEMLKLDGVYASRGGRNRPNSMKYGPIREVSQ